MLLHLFSVLVSQPFLKPKGQKGLLKTQGLCSAPLRARAHWSSIWRVADQPQGVCRKDAHHRNIRMRVCFLRLGVRNRSANEGLSFSEASSSMESIWERLSITTPGLYAHDSPQRWGPCRSCPNPIKRRTPSGLPYLQVSGGHLPVLLCNLLHDPYRLSGSLLG